MDGVPVKARIRCAQLAARIQKLIALDAIMTRAIDSAPLEKNDLETLRVMVSESEQLYAYCVREVPWLSELIANRKNDVFREFHEAIKRSPLTDSAKSRLSHRFGDTESLVAFLSRALSGLPQRSNAEIQYLQTQIASLARHEKADGDMLRETLCVLEGAGVGALIFINPTAAIGVALKVLTDCF
jgi:hypothetical protein